MEWIFYLIALVFNIISCFLIGDIRIFFGIVFCNLSIAIFNICDKNFKKK